MEMIKIPNPEAEILAAKPLPVSYWLCEFEQTA